MKWSVEVFDLLIEVDEEDIGTFVKAKTIRNESQANSFEKKAGVFFIDVTISKPFTNYEDVEDTLVLEIETELTQEEIEQMDNKEIIELITDNEWKSYSW